MGWGGGQPAIRVAGQPPAALVDRPVVGPADQGQIGQIGGAAVPPVDQMVGLTPRRRPQAVGERAAPVPHGQGGPLGGADHPGGPADLQRLGAGPAQGRREQPGRRLEPGRQAAMGTGGVLVAVATGAVSGGRSWPSPWWGSW
jgi:hypothetical protein